MGSGEGKTFRNMHGEILNSCAYANTGFRVL